MNSAENPLIKDSASESLNAIAQGLEYIVSTFPDPTTENENGIMTHTFTRNELFGLKRLIECSQKAVEGCYEQHQQELKTLQHS